MNMFEKFLYPIMKNEPAPHPDVEHCPAVLAERAGKDAQEICRICEKCYDELVANQKKEQPMYRTFNLQIIRANCPKGMTEKDCPVQQYLNKQNMFRITINETLLEPMKSYLSAREEYIATLDKIHELCAKCQGKNK